ncbi:hypothetical protein ACLKA6_009221 [Drosophila palustris]
MENDDYQPLLRRRRNSYLKWTESQVLEFLELVLDLVKDVPESLEKPTAQKFYTKVMERSYTFKDLNYVVLKNKMRLLRTQFISAVQWRSNTEAGFYGHWALTYYVCTFKWSATPSLAVTRGSKDEFAGGRKRDESMQIKRSRGEKEDRERDLE